MTIDLTRRTLLHLAGASSLGAAAAAAAQAEGTASNGPTFANRTPMRVGMVTLRVRDLDKVADYYRDAIGLTVMTRTATGCPLSARAACRCSISNGVRARRARRETPPASITPRS